MLDRLVRRICWPAVVRDADRLVEARGVFGALFVARHAVTAAREQHRAHHWTRVLHEVERRFGDRPW